MKPLVEEVSKFEILNPSATPDDCIEFLKSNKSLFLARFN